MPRSGPTEPRDPVARGRGQPTRHALFATCAPGLEPALYAEVRELRFAKPEQQVGGVYFEGTAADTWRANLELRTAVRVLLRLGRFAAPDADALYAGVQATDWESYLAPHSTLAVLAQTRDSSLTHSEFIAQRTKDAIVDQFRQRLGTRPSVDRDDPDLLVHIHLSRDRATLSLDTSGPALHRRGWRRHQGRAPLAENLAAGVVLLSGWDRRAPLIDPFCGSGTLLIEAAWLAAGRPPGGLRSFGFERWPGHDDRRWQALRGPAVARPPHPRRPRLIGSDIDPERVEQARQNAAAAGVGDWVQFEVADAGTFAPRPGWNAWIASNLPYGRRIGDDRRRRAALQRFGRAMRTNAAGYRYALLCGNDEDAPTLGLTAGRSIALLNGGIPITLLLGAVDDPTSTASG